MELLLRERVRKVGGGIPNLGVRHVARINDFDGSIVVGDVVLDHADGLVEGAESVVLQRDRQMYHSNQEFQSADDNMQD